MPQVNAPPAIVGSANIQRSPTPTKAEGNRDFGYQGNMANVGGGGGQNNYSKSAYGKSAGCGCGGDDNNNNAMFWGLASIVIGGALVYAGGR